MKKFWCLTATICWHLAVLQPAPGAAAERIPVFVSIVPQKYFVKKIGGGRVDVSVMVPPGANPATYEPKPKQMVALSKARLYFAVGVPFETTWMEKIVSANVGLRVVYTQHGIEKRAMNINRGAPQGRDDPKGGRRLPENRTSKHGKRRSDGLKDPHIWLSPPLVMIQARNILTGLLKIDPAHAAAYERRYRSFSIELLDLDAEIRKIFSGAESRVRFMVFHPAWGYFADAYGLEQIPIEIEGKDPKPAQLGKLIDLAKKLGVKVIFVQPQFSTKRAGIIARAIKGEVVSADPLAPDWYENMRNQSALFKKALR
jgi:zinc transport system substrate-binding protein